MCVVRAVYHGEENKQHQRPNCVVEDEGDLYLLSFGDVEDVAKKESHDVTVTSATPRRIVNTNQVHPTLSGSFDSDVFFNASVIDQCQVEGTSEREDEGKNCKKKPPEKSKCFVPSPILGEPKGVDDGWGEEEEPHLGAEVPALANTLAPTLSVEVVDVEQVEPPALLTLGDQGRHQVGLRPARGKLEEGGVQGDDDGVDPGQSDVAVDVEHKPHHLVAPVGLVQLLHGVEGKQAASDDKKSVDTNEPIPEDCGSHVVSLLTCRAESEERLRSG